MCESGFPLYFSLFLLVFLFQLPVPFSIPIRFPFSFITFLHYRANKNHILSYPITFLYKNHILSYTIRFPFSFITFQYYRANKNHILHILLLFYTKIISYHSLFKSSLHIKSLIFLVFLTKNK